MSTAPALLQPEDVARLTWQVQWGAAALGLVLGWLLQRSHFCTMGAISDYLLFRAGARLRQWVLTVVLGALGFAALHAAGWLDPADTLYAAPRWPWLSMLVGGLLFGVGMVLASGCPTKNLVRLGGGSLKALVVLLVMGVSALATLRGLPGLWRVRHLDPITATPPEGPFVSALWPSTLNLSPGQASVLTAVVLALCVLPWLWRDRSFWRWTGAGTSLALALVLLALWWLSGVWGFVPEHPATLERAFVATGSGRAEGMSFTAPVAQWLDGWMYAADGGKRITMGMALVPGVLLGAGLAAWRSGQWRWEGFTQTADLGRHVVGAVLMGFGGVSAMGCTFGQGITGLSTLNWGSVLAVLAMVAGAVLALRLQWWLAARQA